MKISSPSAKLLPQRVSIIDCIRCVVFVSEVGGNFDGETSVSRVSPKIIFHEQTAQFYSPKSIASFITG